MYFKIAFCCLLNIISYLPKHIYNIKYIMNIISYLSSELHHELLFLIKVWLDNLFYIVLLGFLPNWYFPFVSLQSVSVRIRHNH